MIAPRLLKSDPIQKSQSCSEALVENIGQKNNKAAALVLLIALMPIADLMLDCAFLAGLPIGSTRRAEHESA